MKLSERVWLATVDGPRPAPDLAYPADREAIQDHCRGGAMVMITRGWRTEVFVDPVAQSADERWSAKLDTSLTTRRPTFLLHVLSCDSWHTSSHAAVDELRAALAGWIRLACHGVRRTHRFWPMAAAARREPGGSPDPRPAPRWLEPLLTALSATAFASAHELYDAARRHAEARETALVAFGPGRPPAVDRFEHHCAGGEFPELALPSINSWLIETWSTGRVIVTEYRLPAATSARAIVVFPTIWRIEGQTSEPSVAAIRLGMKPSPY